MKYAFKLFIWWLNLKRQRAICRIFGHKWLLCTEQRNRPKTKVCMRCHKIVAEYGEAE